MSNTTRLQKVHKFSKFFEGMFLVAAIVSLLSLTVFSFSFLNPKVDNTIKSSGIVAGVNSVSELEFKNSYMYPNHTVEFNADDNGGNFKIQLESLSVGQTIVDLVEIINNSGQTSSIEITSSLQGNVNDLIDLYIVKDGVRYKLFDSFSGNSPIDLEIDSDTSLSLIYDSKEKISFPFTLNLSLSY